MLSKPTLKKALNLSAFFMLCILAFSPKLSLANNCVNNDLSPPEKAIVKWVYDGDTLLLTDDRKIRVIGIDTPEVKHHKQKAQAYGAKAKEALRELLKKNDYKIFLRYGKEHLDKYSRILAHVYTLDGINISNWLLEKGFARTLSYPPNVLLADCYKESEKQAQQSKLRIWRLKSHQLKDAETLSIRKSGFVQLKGKVLKIKYNKKSIIMELASNKKRPIRIKLRKKNLAYFKNLDLDKLWGQTIQISGILKSHRGKRTIYLNHPTQINSLKRKKKRVAPIIKWSSPNEN